ncbi:MAG TPA: adenylate cyclase [Ruminococcus sp.]|nr:adenylate cyclase [Ruminococcus sp.]
MSNIRSTNLRFNLDKPLYEKAWTYLQNMDKSEFKSYNHAIALSVAQYFDRYYQKESDPYFETREREESFIEQIVLAVEKAIEKALPSFLTACLSGIVQPYKQIEAAEPAKEETNDEIDWDFLNE